MGSARYKAFISYSHNDREHAKWLYRKLETFTFPKHLVNTPSVTGRVPNNLKPVFRDREELSAGHNLGEKIESALKASENLIIICSPHAAQSYWVNQEILFFKRHNLEAKIFSVIVAGHPFAHASHEECFPKALRFEIDETGELSDQPAEPLAADLRNTGDGKRLGLLKLISGMVGLGVNDLIQRDLQRARRRVTAITATACGIVLAMGLLTWTAMDARQEAEQRRNDAEGQIEFMLTDLKDELKGVGRLKALEIVGERAAQYYDNYPFSDHDDDALGRRARVFHYLGELQDEYGDLEEAERYFLSAYSSTSALLERNPDNPDRTFDHAQSAYWIARIPWQKAEYQMVKPHYDEYRLLAERLYDLENGSQRSILELGYAFTNLGSLYFQMGELIDARQSFEASLEHYRRLIDIDPQSRLYKYDYANALAWLSDLLSVEGDYSLAIQHREEATRQYFALSKHNAINYEIEYELMISNRALSKLHLASGNYPAAIEYLSTSEIIGQMLITHDSKNQDWQAEFRQLETVRQKISELAAVQNDND